MNQVGKVFKTASFIFSFFIELLCTANSNFDIFNALCQLFIQS